MFKSLFFKISQIFASVFFALIFGSFSTAKNSKNIHKIVKIALSQNRLEKPNFVFNIGEIATAIAKLSPIITPIKLIAFALDSSFVKSLISAIATPPTAPQPCKIRPKIKVQISFANAQIKDPKINIKSPIQIIFCDQIYR